MQSYDTHGREVPEGVLVTIREDAPAGITLEGGRTVAPGETAEVPHAIARRLLATGRAVIVTDAEDVETGDPEDVDTRDPEPETRDPKPRGKRAKAK